MELFKDIKIFIMTGVILKTAETTYLLFKLN